MKESIQSYINKHKDSKERQEKLNSLLESNEWNVCILQSNITRILDNISFFYKDEPYA